MSVTDGLQNQNPLWHVSVRVPYKTVEGCVDVLEQQEFLGVSWTECDDSTPLDLLDESGFPIASEFQIDGYTKKCPDAGFLTAAFECVFSLLGIELEPRLSVKVVDDTDWLEACYVAMPAQKYGCFYVYGSHIKDPAPNEMIPVLVDAATAFGSGEHPTTAGCLTMLAKLSETTTFNNILDMGCGSGILGIAAKKRCQGAHVTLIDNDPESIRVSNHNAERNDVDVSCYVSEGFAGGAVRDFTNFDLILANILAKPVCALAPDFAIKITKGGFVVVSGLLSRHTDMVCEHYKEAGFSLYEQLNINDWMTLVFQ